MGRLVLRFNRPMATAAAARSLSRAASLQSSSSIFLRQSEMSIEFQPRATSHELRGEERPYKFCHSRRFPSGILFNQMHNSAAHDPSLGKSPDRCELFCSGDSKSNRNRKLCKSPKALDQRLCVSRHFLARARHAGPRDRIDKSSRNLCDQLQTFISAGGRRQKNSCEIIFTGLAQISSSLLDRQISS